MSNHVQHKIKTLRLNFNFIGPSGAIALAELLKKDNVIEHLDLSLNEMGIFISLFFPPFFIYFSELFLILIFFKNYLIIILLIFY